MWVLNMRYSKTSPVFFPFLIFLVFLILSLTDVFQLTPPDEGSNYLADHIFFYIVNIGAWLFGAVLFNALVTTFIWGGVLKQSVGSGMNQVLIDFSAIFIYALGLSGIITIVFSEPFSTSWQIILLIFIIIGTASRRIFLTLFKGSFFSTENPYNIGDWIELIGRNLGAEIVGEVIDITRRSTKLRTEEGEIIFIPNHIIYDFVIKNISGTQKEIKLSALFTLDFSVEVHRAKRVLIAGTVNAFTELGVIPEKEPEILVTKTSDLGVEYQVNFWMKPWAKFSPGQITDKVNTFILEHLVHSGLTLAYPKSDVFHSEMPLRQVDLDSPAERKKILSENDLFDTFSEDELEILSAVVIHKENIKNDVIIKQDDSGDSMFIVVEGLLQVYVNSKEGEHIPVGVISPGGYFGEMSLLTGEVRSATVTAETDVILYEVKQEHLKKLIKDRPSIIEELSKTIAKRRDVNLQKIEEAEGKDHHFYKEILGKIKSFFNMH
jgi:small-conductance mechanosensitive channel